jgi:hypothetical protein
VTRLAIQVKALRVGPRSTPPTRSAHSSARKPSGTSRPSSTTRSGAVRGWRLANLTVAFALQKFREQVLSPNRWDRTKGATLKTYFIVQCLAGS